MDKIKCIDVSEWQPNIDWAKVKKAGIDCVILRAGFGREATQIDAEFEKHYKNAKAAGLKVGVYWYSYANSIADARREAEACLKVLKGKTLELPVFYDMEDGSQTGFLKEDLTAMGEVFCDTVKKGGFVPGVYANLNWFNNYLDYNKLKKKYFIWLAQYNNEAQLGCDIWQYSSSGKVAGITGNVDMNIIYNNDLIGGEEMRTELKKGDKGLDVLCLKNNLQVASDMGIVDFKMTPGNDAFGDGTEKAVKALQKVLGVKQTGVADAGFVNKLYAKIKAHYPVVGDVNGDGKINIKDATALQKQIAGVK